jgi:hypothetical protein
MSDIAKQLKKLNGSVIMIESARSGGCFMDSSDNSAAKVSQCVRSQRTECVWAKWILHHIKDEIVVLESVRCRDHYLDMHHSTAEFNAFLFTDHHVSRITERADIPTADDTAFCFRIWGAALDDVGIQSTRWTNRWLDCHHSGKLLGSKGPAKSRVEHTWGKFKIQFSSKIQDAMIPVASYENLSEAAVPFTFKYKTGLSRSDGTSHKVSGEVNFEMAANFGVGAFPSASATFGAKYSHEWSTSSSTTWSKASESDVTITVKSGKKVEILQLQASYGPFQIMHHKFIVRNV